MDNSSYSLHTAKVFSTVLVRKCGNFLIPRITKMHSARAQVFKMTSFFEVGTPYLAECGVSSSLSGIGSTTTF